MKKLADRPITSITLKQLMRHDKGDHLGFFEGRNEALAREWLIHFLDHNDPEGLAHRQLNFVIFNILARTGGFAGDLVEGYHHESWRHLKIFLLNAVKRGVYPW